MTLDRKKRAAPVLPKWALDGWVAFTESIGPNPFRLSALTQLLYPKTSPRSREKAERIAAQLIQRAHKAGEIGRHGHLHWVRLTQGRTLVSGRKVPEHTELHSLRVETHCPDKYVLVDLETGCLWQGTARSWVRAADPAISEARAILALAKADAVGGAADPSVAQDGKTLLPVPLSGKENRVLEEIAARKGMSAEAVLRQSLRWLQLLEETPGAYDAINALRPTLKASWTKSTPPT